MLPFFLECCCQSADDARRAEVSGASRIELCEELAVAGLTPSDENILATLAAVHIPVNVLVRCRAGNFVYTEEEIDTMVRSIAHIRQLTAAAPDGTTRRVNAVVVGALTVEGSVDKEATRRFIAAAGNLPITFHRAFDLCYDPVQAYDDIALLGIDRILTSGHRPTVAEGCGQLTELVEKSKGTSPCGKPNPVVLVGGGVRPQNIRVLAVAIGASEYHSSCLEGWDKVSWKGIERVNK